LDATLSTRTSTVRAPAPWARLAAWTLAGALLHTSARASDPPAPPPLGPGTQAAPATALVTVFTPAYLDTVDAIGGLLKPAQAASSAPEAATAAALAVPPDLPVRPARLAPGQDCAPRAEDYPQGALRARATGVTRLRIGVSASGRAASLDILQSAGPTRAHAALDREAVQRLAECRFEPARDGAGRPIPADFEAEVVWILP
jgi:protein TonB